MTTDVSLKNLDATKQHESNVVLREAAAELHVSDRDRYLMAMMADPVDRVGLLTIFAFNLELARIPEKVTEPILGQMRLQSIRDALARARRGEAPGLPIAKLLTACEAEPSIVDALIDARERDLLRSEPFADMDALRKYAVETGGLLTRLALRYLGRDIGQAEAFETVAEHAGTAYSMAGLARAVPHRHPSQRSYVPVNLVSNDSPSEMRRAVRKIAEAASREIAAAREVAAQKGGRPDRRLFPAFAAATIAEAQLRSLQRHEFDPTHPRTTYRGAGSAIELAWRRWRNRF